MRTSSARVVAGEGRRRSWDEICRIYPDEWVVLLDVDWVNETDWDFTSGEVVSHYKRRKECSPDVKALLALRREVACIWTGEIRAPFPPFLPTVSLAEPSPSKVRKRSSPPETARADSMNPDDVRAVCDGKRLPWDEICKRFLTGGSCSPTSTG